MKRIVIAVLLFVAVAWAAAPTLHFKRVNEFQGILTCSAGEHLVTATVNYTTAVVECQFP